MFGYWCGMWERSVRQESYDFCVSPSLLSFSHFVPEFVGKIFGFFRSEKLGLNFSYEPTGSPSSKYEHRRASVLLRNIQNIIICMGKNLSFL